MTMGKRILYHFTSTYHLPSILAAETLTLTESNIGSPNEAWEPYGEHYGPDVVWCFNVPKPIMGSPTMLMARGTTAGGDHFLIDKRLVRITIEVPEEDVVRFTPWAKDLGIHPSWLKVMQKGNPSKNWYCVLRPVPMDEWLTVEIRERVDAPWIEDLEGPTS